MEMLPGQLSTIVATYSNQIKEETARHDGAMQAIVNTFNTKKTEYRDTEAKRLQGSRRGEKYHLRTVERFKRENATVGFSLF